MSHPLCKTSYKLLQNCINSSPVKAMACLGTILFCVGLQAATDIDQLPTLGEWERTSDSPLSPRNSASIWWDGREIFVFGGSDFACASASLCMTPSTPPFSDGAAYNPDTDTWREIADAPVSILGSQIVTVGSDIFALIWTSYDSRSSRLFRYQSLLDKWDEFNSPEVLTSTSIVALGTDIILYKSSHENGQVSDWKMDTLTGQWTRLADSPLGLGFSRQIIPLGNDLYLFDHELVPNPGGDGIPSYLRGAKFSQEHWELLPQSDIIGTFPILTAGTLLISPELGCADGGKANGFGTCIAFGAIFDTITSTWHELPSAPNRGMKNVQSSGGLSDSDLVLTQTGYPALDAINGEWFIVPKLDSTRSTQRAVKVAGPYGFAFGGATSLFNVGTVLLKDAWIWKP